MDKTEEFIELFIDVWKNGISGINISEIIIALLIFFLFLFLRGLFAKFIIKRLEKACGVDILAPGFPAKMIDDEAEETGYEIIPKY